MNNNEAQRILDKGAIPFGKFRRAIKDNDILSEEEKQALYDIVISCEKAREDGSDYDYSEAIDRVANVINNHPATRDYDLGYNDVPMVAMEMPFLIKQVLFYLYYQIKMAESGKKSNKYTIEDFMSRLSSNGVCKTKKFLNVGGLTPEKYFTLTQYKQPTNPCKYKGQKKEELAEAIKNLAYQAGSYTYFVDVFGGSGSATTALFPQDKVKQVYNEKNRAVYNLFEVISGDSYKELQSALTILQNDLSRADYTINSYFGFDIETVLTQYIKDMYGGDEEKIAESPEGKIFRAYGCEFRFYDKEKETYMDIFSEQIKDKFPKDDTYEEYRYSDIEKWRTKEDFDSHFKVIRGIELEYFGKYYSNKCIIRLNGDSVKGDTVIETNIFYRDYQYNIVQLKALAYFAYFEALRKSAKIENKVKCAVGEIFLHRLSTHGDIINSAILAYNRNELENQRNETDSFIRDTRVTSYIEEFHNRVSRCSEQKLLRNTDFRDVIDEFENIGKNVLFYVDSPYIGTSDYDEDFNNVEKFEKQDMKALIQKLTDSKQKFIFSMRAVITGGEKADKIKKNESLEECVYTPFKEYNKSNRKKLYVLVILKNGKDLGNAISKSEVVEIMVTNYPIVSFDNYKKSKNTQFKYEVYKYKDFKDIIDKNMLV